jgi:hypothetical protein
MTTPPEHENWDTFGDQPEEEGVFVENLPYRARGPKTGRVYDWKAVADRCRDQPGKWYLAFKNIPRSHAHEIKMGRKPEFPGGEEEWLVTTSGKRNKPGDLYIAYVGTPGARRRAMEAAKGRKLTRGRS